MVTDDSDTHHCNSYFRKSHNEKRSFGELGWPGRFVFRIATKRLRPVERMIAMVSKITLQRTGSAWTFANQYINLVF